MHTPPTYDRLRELLDYDAETGLFRWRVSRGKAAKGYIAGSPDSDGYTFIGIDGHRWAAHRLAWFYVTGAWPEKTVDHADICKTNNAFSNLRLADFSEQRANVGLQVCNTSGFKGVHFNKGAGRWRSILKFRGASYFLGYFDTPEAAHAAYCAKAAVVHGDFARAS